MNNSYSDEELYLAEEEAMNDPVYLLNHAALDINVVQDNLSCKVISGSEELQSAQDYITKALRILEPKTIITFGSGQIPWFKGNPLKVMLVIDKNIQDARSEVFKTQIGPNFCTSYNYYDESEEFQKKYNMKAYKLNQILVGADQYDGGEEQW